MEDNRNKVFSLANNNSANKSETPEPLSDKSTCASIPAAEVAKIQDYTSPEAIPEGKNGTTPVRMSKTCSSEDILSSDNSAMCRYNKLCDSNLNLCVCRQKCCAGGGGSPTWRNCNVWFRPSIAGASERRFCRNRSKNIWST